MEEEDDTLRLGEETREDSEVMMGGPLYAEFDLI